MSSWSQVCIIIKNIKKYYEMIKYVKNVKLNSKYKNNHIFIQFVRIWFKNIEFDHNVINYLNMFFVIIFL